MAIENNDLLVLQKNGGGELRKATVAALLSEVVTPTVPDEISDLSDVDTTGVTNGQCLVYSTDTWVPQDLPEGASVAVSNSPPADGNEGDLYWDINDARMFIYITSLGNPSWVPTTPVPEGIDGGTY